MLFSLAQQQMARLTGIAILTWLFFSYDATDDNRLKIMADCWMKTTGYHLDIQPIVFSMEDYYDQENDFIQKEIIAKGIELPLPVQ